MKAASIYSTNGAMAFQFGNSRALVTATSSTFQVLKDGEWKIAARQRQLCKETIAKVKAAIGK